MVLLISVFPPGPVAWRRRRSPGPVARRRRRHPRPVSWRRISFLFLLLFISLRVGCAAPDGGYCFTTLYSSAVVSGKRLLLHTWICSSASNSVSQSPAPGRSTHCPWLSVSILYIVLFLLLFISLRAGCAAPNGCYLSSSSAYSSRHALRIA